MIRQSVTRWEETELKEELQRKGEWKKEFASESRIPVKPVYTPLDIEDSDWDYEEQLGLPGQYPYTRGISPNMYRSSLFKVRQYAGFGTAKTANEFYKYLLEQGVNELSVAMDLPTQIGYDSDHPMAEGEVGKIGVAINSLLDFEEIYDGIPLDQVTTATTANSIGPIFLAWMLALARKRGLAPGKIKLLNLQNEVLKEFVARGTFIFQVKPSVKFACDAIEYCLRNHLDNIMPINYCEYHLREAGGDVGQGLGFCVANAIAYMEDLTGRGIDPNHFPNPWINSTVGVDLFEEVCKFRAFRRMWARVMKDRFAVTNPRVLALAFRCGPQGTCYTAQQPLNNIVRGTLSALAQVLGGAQSVGVHSYDEALSIPSPESVRVAIRTAQIIGYESGIVNTADPLGGSYYVEALTNEIERRSMEWFKRTEEAGGAVTAIESGYMGRELARSAYRELREVESGERTIVGVNKFRVNEPSPAKIFRVDPSVEQDQLEKLRKLRRERDNAGAAAAVKDVRQAALEGVNLVPPILAAVESYATIGEICGALRSVFGEYKEKY